MAIKLDVVVTVVPETVYTVAIEQPRSDDDELPRDVSRARLRQRTGKYASLP